MVSPASAAYSAASVAAGLVTSRPGWFESGTLSFEFVKGLPTTLVAIAVALIAFRQYHVAKEQKRVAHEKLRLDLFDRRYEVFELTLAMVASMIDGLQSTESIRANLKVDSDFHVAIARARFLFGDDVTSYMNEVSRRCSAQQTMQASAAQHGAMRPEDAAPYAENATWLSAQINTGAREVFARYLDFGEWRWARG